MTKSGHTVTPVSKPIVAYIGTASLYPHAPSQAGYGVRLRVDLNTATLSGGARDTTIKTMLPAAIVDIMLSVPSHVPLDMRFERCFSGANADEVMSRISCCMSEDQVEQGLWQSVRLLLPHRKAQTIIRGPDYARSQETDFGMAQAEAWRALFKCGPRPRSSRKRPSP